MGLLTIGVLGFQALIFASMYLAAKLGRHALNTCAGAWTLFTLLGSIATAGLMLLQMITIVLSYLHFAKNPASAASSKPARTASQVVGDAWNILTNAIFAILAVGWIIMEWTK